MFDIYLASQSPRRAELLTQIGVRFKQCSVDVDESVLQSESPKGYITRVTRLKLVAACAKLGSDKPVLVADTSVILGDVIMGKPTSFEQSAKMLKQLSNVWHEVYTMVAVGYENQIYQTLQISRVKFRPISSEEMQAYWDSGEPQDKAGSYGIQGLGSVFIERIEGSYTGIMGLPHFEAAKLLEKCGIKILGESA